MITNEFKMNCKAFKNISLLFIDNELSEELKCSATDHLLTCESCKTYVQNINALYSETNNLLKDKKTDLYFYTRLKVRMESEISYSKKGFRQISYYLQPAFYTLIAFTLLLSILMLTGNIKNKQQTISSSFAQTTNSDEQDYMKTIAMNDKTFEEDYINIIDK